jgi:16S rRNA (adenine(1408)-N(1))-methyltransferase
VRWLAQHRPDTLVIGVDASGDGLREISRRVAAKPARGGLPNALCGRLSLEGAPGELAGLADGLSVLLPWGSLLRGVALPEARALAALRALCKPGAEVRVLFGYGPGADAAMIRALDLPPLDADAAASMLEARYREAGLAVIARRPSLEEVRALPTTWAKRLAFSARERAFIELRGKAVGGG